VAITDVQILERNRLPDGQVEVVYCATATPGVRYKTIASSDLGIAIDAAIAAHMRRRLEAGQDYPGKPEPAPQVRTLIF